MKERLKVTTFRIFVLTGKEVSFEVVSVQSSRSFALISEEKVIEFLLI